MGLIIFEPLKNKLKKMKNIFWTTTIFLLLNSIQLFSENNRHKFINKVDLFTCTSSDFGQLDPAACVPFGMVKLGPETNPGNHSGYDFTSKNIKGFSHNRLPGVGCNGAGGNILVLPGIGDFSNPSASVDKKTEYAHPGYYKIKLAESGILAELTANNYVGIHKYTFPESGQSFLTFDFSYNLSKLISNGYEIKDNQTITGYIRATNNCDIGAYTTYFSIRFPKPVTFEKQTDGKVIARFSTKSNETFVLQVALSPISVEQAETDRVNSVGVKEFDEIKKDAEEKWETLLGRVEVSGNTEYEKLFYTHLYHSCLMPVNSTSTTGMFKGTDGNIYKADGYIHYDGWSIWDTFRSKLPLISLLYPEIYQDFAKSIVDLYKYGKYAGAGENEPVPTCRTEHAVGILLDAFQKGMDFDLVAVWKEILAESDSLLYKSPDNILETSYDYWTIARIAEMLNKKDEVKIFQAKAMNYKKVWKEKFLVMDENSDIMHGDGLYEGTLWQYRWFVPFDYDGVFKMLGGKDVFNQQLEFFFENDLYNHGNQPDIHAPFLFNYSGKSWLTQKWVNQILTKPMEQHYGTHKKWEKPYLGRIYKLDPEGYIEEMDDDAGTMSSWYVLSSMGLFQVCVGNPVYQLSAPLFENIVIRYPQGNDFNIEVKNPSANNFYIQKVVVNGEKYDKNFIPYNIIRKGGKMLIELKEKPNTNWGEAAGVY